MKLDVTVVMTVRETFSTSMTALTSVLGNIPESVVVIFVASGVPDETMKELKKIASGRKVEFLEIDVFLTPTQARNIAMKSVATRYVAFVDNDVIVQENWLEALVECAVEENATLVVPLVFEHYPLWQYIHIAGGESQIIETPEGHRVCHQLPHSMHHDNVADPKEFKRSETTLVEFHTLLAETEFIHEIGGMDEEIRCMFEEWDICIQAMNLKKRIFFEPKSKITYLAPRNPSVDDIRYFDLRWSEHWLNESIERMITKYQLTPNMGNLKAGRTFVKDHRLHKYWTVRLQLRKVFGQKISDVIMNRVVAYWDKLNNDRVIDADYQAWKKYTENIPTS